MATTATETSNPAADIAAGDSALSALLRLTLGFALAVFVTLGLLWLMQYLIVTADRALDESGKVHLVDFVRVRRAETVQRRELKPEKPPAPEAPPEQPPTPKLDNIDARAEKIAVAAVPVETEIELTGAGFSLGVGEGDYLPIVKVAPVYPGRALSRNVEGYCIVEYTVTRLGTTADIRVLEDQCTSSLFHRPSVAAATKFKYKPRVIDGVAVEVPGVRNKFTYKIAE